MKRLLAIIVVATLPVLLLAAPAYADTPNPDDPPNVEGVWVYRNLLEIGDRLFVVYANIPYATPPPTLVTETFIWRLIDTDGVTEVGSTTGSAFHSSGYGYNVYSFYFSADDALEWGEAYTVRLLGNPVVFVTPPVYNFPVNTDDYTPVEGGDYNRTLLAHRVIYLAMGLDNRWAPEPDVALTAQTEVGPKLSLPGEAFFRGAIPGIQAMAPDAFQVVVRPIDIEPREWDMQYREDLQNQWEGTWLDTAKAAGAALFGADYDLLSIILLGVLCCGVLFAGVATSGDAWNGVIDVAVVGVIAARLGVYDLGFLALLAAIAFLYIGVRLWGLAR